MTTPSSGIAVGLAQQGRERHILARLSCGLSGPRNSMGDRPHVERRRIRVRRKLERRGPGRSRCLSLTKLPSGAVFLGFST